VEKEKAVRNRTSPRLSTDEEVSDLTMSAYYLHFLSTVDLAKDGQRPAKPESGSGDRSLVDPEIDLRAAIAARPLRGSKAQAVQATEILVTLQ
jgi:hypothetical protein